MSESETQDDASSAVSLTAHARRSLTIANLIVGELPDALDEIALHLRAGWTALAGASASESDGGQRRAIDIEPDFLPAREREEFRQSMSKLMDSSESDAGLTLDELRRHARWLTLALGPAEARARKRAGLPHPARRTLTAVIALGVLFTVLTGAGIAWQRIVAGPAPWRVTFFAKEKFKGRTVTRMYEQIDFRWANNRPVFRIPNDRFAVRADTCLSVPDGASVGFALLSDDGSRLHIDDQVAIDNWGIHGERTRTASLTLNPGVHHLVIEYFDRTENARLQLIIDDQDGNPIPRSWLHRPSGSADADAPCR
jgi:hypothetical protein